NLSALTTYDYAIAAVNPSGTSTFSLAVSATTAFVNIFGFVPESTNYRLIYRLPIPEQGNFRFSVPVPYAEDFSSSFTGGFDRIAYYLELESSLGLEWVYVSMDAFTADVGTIGLPHHINNPVIFQQVVSNMTIFASSGAPVVTGTHLSTGNIEMWPGNYSRSNSIAIPNATSIGFDFGDSTPDLHVGYGSFQIHHHGATQTVFAYNRWGVGGKSDLGIGNGKEGFSDWTFIQNAAFYTTRTLLILVRPTDTDIDGIDDSWELQHFGNLTEADADSDVDADGSSDLNEYIAGTVPTNPASSFFVKILPSEQSQHIRIQWPSAQNRIYHLECSTNIHRSWTLFATNIPPTVPTNTTTVGLEFLEHPRFYRVRVRMK
ncbi:MAG: hypothetical protein AAF492_25480, partial [Verrucomicrobiota bacterium]